MKNISDIKLKIYLPTNDRLTPEQIKVMPLDEFHSRFGFRPKDALEKYLFVISGEGHMPDVELMRAAIEKGVLDEPNLDGYVME